MLRIFTDTAANVPPHLLEQYHITAMPLTYLLDGQPTELVGHDYYEAMRKGAGGSQNAGEGLYGR